MAIDDSLSMSGNGAGRLALEALTLLCTSLSKLEVSMKRSFCDFDLKTHETCRSASWLSSALVTQYVGTWKGGHASPLT